MKGIGVFHDEFPSSHQAKAGPDLVAKLGLDLVEVHRQLPIGPQQIARQAGDNFFMGGTQPKFPSLAILQVKHDPFASRVALPTTTALPQF